MSCFDLGETVVVGRIVLWVQSGFLGLCWERHKEKMLVGGGRRTLVVTMTNAFGASLVEAQLGEK